MIKNAAVRFSDIDAQGHASHLAILGWIAEARIEMLDDAVRRAGLWGRVDYVLARIEADFREEVQYPGTVEVLARVVAIGGKSVTSTYTVLREIPDATTVTVATAECVSVFFDVATKKTIRVPDEVRAAIRVEEDSECI